MKRVKIFVLGLVLGVAGVAYAAGNSVATGVEEKPDACSQMGCCSGGSCQMGGSCCAARGK